MLVLLVFLGAAGIAFLEASRCAYRSDGEWRDELQASLILGVAAALIEMFIARSGAPNEPSSAGFVLVAGVFLLDDLLYYASHRAAHRIGVFWASHSVHHSSLHFDFFTGLRQPPTWLMTPAAAAPLFLIAAGAPVWVVAASGGLRALHHFLLHTERVRRLPAWVELVFNTPSHHRVHHSSEDGLIDKNFCAVLIVWDRIFGTFAPEPAGGVSKYGVLDAASEGSVLSIVVHPWRRLVQRATRARTGAGKFAALFAPPGRLSG
ncbi:MAG: sterol desaturase family protein [Phycisphaerales bacterium]|nr:sterol desaturase family protein [Hyphomonadaceae bacterium]